jgi:hypothetical protein
LDSGKCDISTKLEISILTHSLLHTHAMHLLERERKRGGGGSCWHVHVDKVVREVK